MNLLISISSPYESLLPCLVFTLLTSAYNRSSVKREEVH